MSGTHDVWFRRCIRSRSLLFAAVGIGVMLVGSAVGRGLAQNAAQGGKAGGAGYPDLVGGLKTTPGCLGVETAQTASGKNVIFAWFEDKKAVMRWYSSEMHQQVMKSFFPAQRYDTPLQGVPDDSGPIMAIASLTLTDKPRFKDTSLPISQISIELYRPLTGGIFLGGRFAPNSLKVPGMRDYTPKEK